jgi:CheY-like chemotaxis protein
MASPWTPPRARKKGQFSPMKSLTVMCVDDDAGIRGLYGALLGQNGYEVIAASNGRQALPVFETKENEIDAVILDYEMLGMNGLEPATWLKQRHPTLPVIMVSGSHPDLEQMAPFVNAAMGKGVPLQHLGPASSPACPFLSSYATLPWSRSVTPSGRKARAAGEPTTKCRLIGFEKDCC